MRRFTLYISAFLALVLVVYLLFLNTLAKPVFEQLATEQYGAEVSIDRIELRPFRGQATLYNLQVVDRRNAMKNLVQAERVYADLDVWRLVDNVVDVSKMEVDGLVSFAPRQSAGTILRPLVEEDSPLAKVGLPDFEIPDLDQLVDRKRDELMAEAEALEQSFETVEAKWKQKVDSIPGEEEIKAYKERIRKLKKPDNPLQALSAVSEVQTVYREINTELDRVRNMQQEFRGDMQMLREQVELAGKLPEKYTNALVRDLGLNPEQIAELGRYILRGDLSGLLQQVLAPLALNASGEADTQENAMPVFVRHATINGSLLPAAAGLSVNGELKDFAWPLDRAQNVATLLLEGSSLSGGKLAVNANVDHRGKPEDRVVVNIADLPLKGMSLAGTEELGITLLQTLASVSGEFRVVDGKLDGAFTQQFAETVFDTTLREGAGRAARLVAEVLKASTDYIMRIGFAGTLQNPQVSFSSDMDRIFQATIQNAISDEVTKLTNQLNQHLSREIGPEVAAARQNFTALESLQAQLQQNLQELNQLAK